MTDLADPLELSDSDQVALAVEMDGRYRAATLDAPHGWITFESYGDWLIDQREARRQAGIWSHHPDPPSFPHRPRIRRVLRRHAGDAKMETLSGRET